MDHLAIVLELYTRAYELFKKYSPTNTQNLGRQTLWIAYRIAQTYYESGKFDMAARYAHPYHYTPKLTLRTRFFERIAKTYRREKWDTMLVPLLSTWYKCAQQLGDMELGVQLLFELLAHGEIVALSFRPSLMCLQVPIRRTTSLMVFKKICWPFCRYVS